jgi:hypothetical protein
MGIYEEILMDHFEIKVGNARVLVHQSFGPAETPRILIICGGEEKTLVVDVDDPSKMSKVEIKVVVAD